jgi:TonB-linked SusC/RagA family outer membrane protein
MKKNFGFSGDIVFPRLKELLRIMKVTLLLILMSAGFVFAGKTYSQTKMLNLKLGNTTVKEVLSRIEDQSEFYFMFSSKIIDVNREVLVDFENQKIEAVLDELFKATDVEFTIKDRIIVLTTPEVLSENSLTALQQRTITGKVTDKTGAPLPGVTVVVKGTTTGTITNADGKFSLTNIPENAFLVFSFVGMQSQEIAVSGKTTVTVVLQEENIGIEEVVAVGFGTQKKVNLTGAVSQIKMDEVVGDRPVMNTSTALQGAIPGLQITRSSMPGQTNNTLNIRGTLSINGGNPLILIDNSPGDINMLNPDDIETISVLKDAASSAIYGARAAAGVVLITTKRPKSDAQFRLDYNVFYGYENSINKPQQAPLVDYLQAYVDAGFTNTYWSNSQNMQKWIGFVKDYKVNPGNYTTIGDGIYVDNNIPYYLNEKDLYDNFLTTGMTNSHNFSASGGTSTLRYRISAGYNNEDGPLLTSKDSYKRMNASAFLSADVTPWFTQEINMRYTQGDRNMYVDEIGGLYTTRLISYYPEGIMPASLSLNGKDTPIFTPKNIILNANTAKTITENPRVMFKSIVKPMKGLDLIFEYTYDRNNNNYDYYSGQWIYTSIQRGEARTPATDYYIKRKYFSAVNNINAYANYTKSFGDHHITAMGGFNQESYYYEYLNARAESQAVMSVPSFGGATGTTLNTDSYSEYSSRSGFYRINYNFKDKYLLETNGRYDGSSKFPTDSRFGFFPSVSVGWQLGRENFMSFAKKYLNELKLRGSYGSIGNQEISPYQYSPDMSIGKSTIWANGNKQVTVIGMPSLVSKNFTWETITTLDFGTDFALFNSRLQGTFDWYQRDTKNMLTAGVVQLPATVGAAAPMQNTASLRTTGWELMLRWSDKIGKLGYRLGLNLYDRISEINEYYNNPSGIIGTYYVGQQLGEIWGYQSDGYYSIDDFADTQLWKLKDNVTKIEGYNVKPGDIKFRNLNDDAGSTNQIDPATSTLTDPGDRSIIGNTTPRYLYGFNAGLNLHGFDLSVMLQGLGKRDYWLSGASLFPFAGVSATDAVFNPVYYNQTDYWKPLSTTVGDPNYYVPSNPNPKLFRIYNQMENIGSNTRVSDKFLQSAAYLRVKNVTLSYTFPSKWIKGLKMSQLKLYSSVENIVTFTTLPKGYDPESLSWSYPFYRTVSFGANITF